jgi:membrane associated rhomboid family serine protease
MFRNLTPVVRALLLTNFIVYGLQWLTNDALLDAFALWPLGPVGCLDCHAFQPWQLVTYAFLHGGFMHLAGNMFALFIFGPDVEGVLGARRFAFYYFACVVGAGLTQLWVAHSISPEPYATLGASGGIFGLLLFYGMTFPQRRVLLIFPPDPDARVAVRDAVRHPGAVAGRLRHQPGRRALRPPGRHGDRVRADPVLAQRQPAALKASRRRCGPACGAGA